MGIDKKPRSNKMTSIKFRNQKNWDWADKILRRKWKMLDGFEAVDCEYDALTGEHKFFDEIGNCARVTYVGNVIFTPAL